MPKKDTTGNSKKDFFSGAPSGSATSAITSLTKSSKQLLKTQEGLPDDVIKDNERRTELEKQVARSINTVLERIPVLANNGSLSSDDADKMFQLSNDSFSTANLANGKFKKNKLADQLEKARETVLESNREHLNQLLSMHKTRVADSMATYNLIIRIIPRMRLALTTYTTSILAPDDFTRTTLNCTVGDTTLDSEEITKFQKIGNDILERYDLNKNINNDILSYLINGRLFYLVTSVNKEIVRMLNEDSANGKTNGNGMSSIYRKLSRDKRIVLRESSDTPKRVNPFINEFKEAFSLNEDVSELDAIAKIDKLQDHLEDIFIISDSSSLIEDTIVENEEGSLIENASSFFGGNSSRLSQVPLQSSSDTNRISEKDIKGQNKAVVRRLSPANIVPLEFNGKIYGYVHLDLVEIDPDNDVLPVDVTNGEGDQSLAISGSANSLNTSLRGNMLSGIVSSTIDVANTKDAGGNSASNLNKGYENPNQEGQISGSEDSRLSFLAKIFANRLSNEANIKILKNNEEFKNAVYNSLAIRKMVDNQKIRVVYLTPEEVVYVNRGHSIFDSVLFFCKIYIATLITILMQNILNGGEKRVTYVEVGEDNNGAHSVNQVLMDIKARRVGSVMGMDLSSVLQLQNQYQDYVIPVVDGEKPVTFETMESLGNKNVDDEFLTWVGKEVYSGMGIPSAYIQEVDNVDFAKILSMQNSRYLRECLSEQNRLSPKLTELIQKIFRIEKSSIQKSSKGNNTSGGDNSYTSFDASSLKIDLPPPAALALTNISDQMSQVTSVLDSLIENSSVFALNNISDDEKAKMKPVVSQRLMHKLVPSMHWDDITLEIQKAVKEYTVAKANFSKSSDTSSSTDSSDSSSY